MSDITKFGKVGVLFGGSSAEREISIQSGEAVLAAMLRQGVDAHAFNPRTQTINELKQYDRVFIALHGLHGEDGTIQGALELMNIPYTGSGVMASAVGMDKWRTKLIWQAAGVATPAFALINAKDELSVVANKLGLPLFVKPANEGSSIGVSKVKEIEDFEGAYRYAAESDPLVIAEKYVSGGEYTVSIVGDTALPIVGIVPKGEYYDYKAKYVSDETEYVCPSGLDPALEAKIQQEALIAFDVLGCTGWGRVDFLMDSDDEHYFIEVNTSPGMTSHSLVPMAAEAAGMSFDELVIKILEMTLGEQDVA